MGLTASTPSTPPWWEDVRERADVPEVAEALGLARGRGARPTYACPACAAEVRSERARDRRGPAGLTTDGGGWKCHRCGEGGSVLDLAARALFGRKAGRGDAAAWRTLRAWCAERGWCEPDPRERGPRRVVTLRPPRPRAPTPPHVRLDPGEVAEVWAACLPVTDDAEVAAWLRSRALDPAKVADRDLARALPEDLDVPRWARCKGRPWAAGWRCVLPTWDATGRMAGLRARWTGDGEPPGPKETTPKDVDAGGLVYADALAAGLLRTGARPGWWPADVAPPLVVAEGGPDFLTWAVRWCDAAEDAPGVFGVWQGAWTLDIGLRVPDGARAALRPHRDKAGDGYALDAWATLIGRCDVVRPELAPPDPATGKAPDDNDLLRAGLLPLDPFEDWHGTDDPAP